MPHLNILFISSFFTNTSTEDRIDAEVTYASSLKNSTYNSTIKVQDINVSYSYENKKYETGIRDIENGTYKKRDEITIYVNKDDPTKISLTSSNNGSWGIGLFTIIIGALTFIGIFDPVIAFIKAFIFPNQDENKDDNKLNTSEVLNDAISGVKNTLNRFKK